MADRTVEMELRLKIGDFQRNAGVAAGSATGMAAALDKAGKSSDGARDALGRFTKGAGETSVGVRSLRTEMFALDAQGKKTREGLDQLGGAAGKVAVVAGLAFAAVGGVSANFAQSMSGIAATGEEARDSIDDLRGAAIQAGADTAFSASEAAGGIENLLRAGVSTADVLGGGLTGSLSLAAAGELEVADAAELAATALTQFKLQGSDVSHVADLLAAGAGKAQGDVSDLGAALKQSGLVAAQTGLSIEETVGTLSAFASAGLLGSDAGTSFKTMLQSLTPSSDKAATAMSDMGFSAYDAQGNFKGMTTVAADLRAGLSEMTVEQQNATLKTIFGSDAVRAASVIYDQGAEGIQGWIDKTNDSGYAAEVAGLRLDNLKGDIEALGGSLETLLITSGDGSQGPLRFLTRGATDAVNALNGLPTPIKDTTVALLGITAVTGGALFFGTKVVGGIVATNAALATLGSTARITGRSLLLMGAKGGAFAAVAIAGMAVASSNDEVTDSFGRLQGSVDSFNLTAADEAFDEMSAAVDAYQERINVDTWELPSLGDFLAKAQNDLNALLTGRGEAGDQSADREAARQQLELMESAAGDLANTLGISIGAMDGSARSTAELTAVARKAAPIMEAAGVTAADLTDALTISKETGDTTQIDALLAQVAAQAPQAASGIDQFTTAAERQAEESKLSAKQIEAQADALAELREAATNSAAAFFDFSLGADEAATSLGEWLTSLEEQAAALRNFTQNTIDAGEKGVSQGLIDHLRELGPEGAKQMKWLADATESEIARANGDFKAYQQGLRDLADVTTGVPALNLRVQDAEGRARIKEIQGLLDKFGMTKAEAKAFLRDAASDEITAVQRLIDHYGITRGEASALLRDLASGPIRQVRATLLGLDGDVATVTIRTNHINTFSGRAGGGVDDNGVPYGAADGGTVPKTGKPYADRFLYFLADGEEVIPNRHGEADAYRAANGIPAARRLAAGGTAGGRTSGTSPLDMGREMRDVARGLKGLEAALEKATDAYTDAREDRRAIIDAVASNFTSDPFGVAASGNIFAADATASGFANPLGVLRQQIADAEKYDTLITRFTRGKRGLRGDALAEVDTLEEAQALRALGRDGRRRYGRLYERRAEVAASAGSSNADFSAATVAELRDLKQEVQKLRRDVKTEERQNRDNADRNADRQVGAMGGAVKGSRRASTRGGRS